MIVQGVVLIPIYLNYFSLEVYGAWLATGNIIGILGMLEGGMNMVFSQKLSFSFGQKNYQDFILIATAGLFITFLIVFMLIFLGLILSPFVPGWTNISNEHFSVITTAFIVASFAAGFGILKQNLAAIVASWLDAHINGFINVISSIFGISTIIVGLISNLGVISIPLGSFTRGLIGSLFLSIYIIKKRNRNNYPKFKLDLTNTRKLIKDTIPMTFSNIGSSIVNQSQYLIISNFINPTATAIYAITIRIFTAISSFIAPVSSAIFNSVAYFNIKEELQKVKDVFSRTLSLQGLMSIWAFGTVLAFNKAFIILWVGEDKYGGDFLTILTFLSLFLSYRFSFVGSFFLALGYIKRNAISNFIESVIKISLIFVLISDIGYLSLPIAQIISSVIALGLYIGLISSSFIIKMKETFLILLNNFLFFIIVYISAILVLFNSKDINSWVLLVSYGSVFSLLILLLALVLSKTLRNEVCGLLKKLNFKRYSAKR